MKIQEILVENKIRTAWEITVNKRNNLKVRCVIGKGKIMLLMSSDDHCDEEVFTVLDETNDAMAQQEKLKKYLGVE